MGFVLKPGQDITVKALNSSGNMEEYEITEVEPPSFFTVNLGTEGAGYETVRIVVHARRELRPKPMTEQRFYKERPARTEREFYGE